MAPRRMKVGHRSADLEGPPRPWTSVSRDTAPRFRVTRARPRRRRGSWYLHADKAMNRQRYFEDFQVGERFESSSRTLTDAHFLFFAGLTGDNHPIHYDDEYAKQTRFGRRLAHGLLLASLTAVGGSTLAPVIEDSITHVWRSLSTDPGDTA